MKSISEQVSSPDRDDLGEDQCLEPIFPDRVEPTLLEWQSQRQVLRSRWDAALGKPSFGNFDKAPEVIDEFERPGCRSTLFEQPTGPETRQLVLLMEPARSSRTPRPGAVVPFYHPDLMAGFDLEKRVPRTERPNVHFGRHLVQQGYVVVCTEAFPYNTVPEPEDKVGFAWWQAATDKLLRDNPRWTGIAKLVWDTSRATDLLVSQRGVNPERIVVIGHSLGGKMAFYTGALDERIKAVISSDFGIGWHFTNWDAPWYLGDQIHAPGFALAHHQLLALLAPRSFLLIGGEADRPESWQYIQEAQKVYRLYGKEHAAGFFYHGAGHQPTEESIRIAYRWLAEQFGLRERAYEL